MQSREESVNREEQIKDKRNQGKWTWMLLTLTLLLVGSLGWGWTQYSQKQQLNTYVEYSHQQSFYELLRNVENVDVLLAKGLVSNSPRQSILLFSNVWREADAAQEKLNQLPIVHELIEKTAKYLNQTGDFSYAVARQIVDGQNISADQRLMLQEMQKEADYLATQLQTLREDIQVNQHTWGITQAQGSAKFRQVSPAFTEVSFRQINTQMSGVPTLIYDGPFSDHIMQQEPRLTGNWVSAEEAAQIALAKVDLPPNEQYQVTGVGTGDGKIPIYRVQIYPVGKPSTEEIVADISQIGGQVVSFINPRAQGTPTLNGEQALEKAQEYLQQKGFPELQATYTQVDTDTATIAFAGVQENVLLYPDQVKVKVALDNGQILGIEALAYLMAHYQREIVQPKISAETIESRLEKGLMVKEIRQAIIPLENKQEVQCWEVQATWEGEEFYLYYNVLDGQEERILKIIETPEGILTI